MTRLLSLRDLEMEEIEEVMSKVGGDLIGQWEAQSGNVLVRLYNFVKTRLIDFANYCGTADSRATLRYE